MHLIDPAPVPAFLVDGDRRPLTDHRGRRIMWVIGPHADSQLLAECLEWGEPRLRYWTSLSEIRIPKELKQSHGSRV